MTIAAKLDEFGKPAWIAALVAGFIVFWPIGLAILFYMFWSGRMSCGAKGRWSDGASSWMRSAGRWHMPSSGNKAFDEYREETLRRLEEEQKEFRSFLDRLRMAKDKSEFDQFMADRKSRPQPPVPTQAEPA